MAQLDLPSVERKILAFWKRERCFEKLVEKNRGKPRWSFLDGPITANNPMGVHHAWGRTYKDVFQRYQAMNNRELRYQNGFDCQGLWVEVEVEKELGFESKREIESYGVGKFVDKCKERVQKYAGIQTEQSIRLGYWMDWDNSYYTMSDENNYTIWEFLKKCHERGFVYHGLDSMPWCPRCGTGLSQHEIHGEDRPLAVHDSPTVRLPIIGREGEYLLIWTTTPWTLTSNVACAVHPDLTYAKVSQNGDIYYLIEERVEPVMAPNGSFEILERFTGERLLDFEYDGPFDDLPAQAGVGHRVIPWKEVSAEEGTGIVHIAPGCGKEDYELGREHDLPAIGPIDEAGIILEGFGRFTGQNAAELAEAVFEDLRAKGILYRVETYEHAYPICWRCKTQLLFRLVDEWYVSMDRLREEIKEVTRQTDWIPTVGRQLEIEWLDNMHDWMISKKRYWGLALPIYKCEDCDVFEVIGSKEELRERAVEGWDRFDGHSPHRPWVDEVKIACPSCGKPTPRIPDVGNPWLDAGIVPYSTMHYNTDREYWKDWFPADWISESFPGQFRNWFYAILAMSTVMENRPPFKLMFGYRLMKDEDGEEMHKSKGNSIEFNEAAENVGADAMRWLFCSHNPEYDLRFGYHKVRDSWREFLVLWNVYQFYLTYSRIDGFDPADNEVPVAERSELDRWILSLLSKLVGTARDSYSSSSVHLFMREIVAFIGSLSRWYLRRSRRRIWKSEDDADKAAAYRTLWECLTTATRLLAPVVPFISEEMYQELVRAQDADAPVSVHLNDFPRREEFAADEDLVAGMDLARATVELGHAARNNAGVKVRQPLAELRVVSPSRKLAAKLEPFTALILDELNLKRIEFTDSATIGDGLFTRTAHLDGKVAGPKYKRLVQPVRAALAAAAVSDGAEVERLQRAGEPIPLEVEGQTIEVDAEEVTVEKVAANGWAIAEDRGMLVALATDITEELRREGRVRDLVRKIQNLRKEVGLDVADRIHLRYQASDALAADIESFAGYVSTEILALELERAETLADSAHTVKLGEETLEVRIEKAET
ncbi:MAG: isoleucine--tRNA ligase [bacterium]|nr:isoleucine--tRNA ligase [bacterium]